MPTPAYLYIEGVTQGVITQGAFTADSVGNVYVEGHEDEVLIQAISHSIMVPTDPQSGQPTGQCKHSPMTVTCALNKSIPLIMNALTNGERLTRVEVRWYRTSTDGRQEHFFTDLMNDAIVTNLVRNLPHAQDPSAADYTQLVNITFNYLKITMEHTKSSTSGSHSWRTPNEA